MADSYDRYDNESSGGGFMMGLLTGTVLGALALAGLLFVTFTRREGAWRARRCRGCGPAAIGR